jgi:hypothetical protein
MKFDLLHTANDYSGRSWALDTKICRDGLAIAPVALHSLTVAALNIVALG